MVAIAALVAASSTRAEESMIDFLLTTARRTEIAFLVELAPFNREILSMRVEAVLAE